MSARDDVRLPKPIDPSNLLAPEERHSPPADSNIRSSLAFSSYHESDYASRRKANGLAVDRSYPKRAANIRPVSLVFAASDPLALAPLARASALPALAPLARASALPALALALPGRALSAPALAPTTPGPGRPSRASPS